MKELLAELARQLAHVPPGTWESIGGAFASIAGAVVLVLIKRPETLAEAARLFTIAFLISTYMAPFVMKKWLSVDSTEASNIGRFISSLGALEIEKRIKSLLGNAKSPPPADGGENVDTHA